MELVSVITPTYNRKHELERLYNSLCNQNNKNFVWIVVDDGSEDGTVDYLNKIKKNAPFKMKVLSKDNGGKHTALNYGIANIDTELTIIVDSDDILLKNAINDIEEIYTRYCSRKNVACYTFLRIRENGEPIVKLKDYEIVANYIDFRIKGNCPGDMAEVFKTSVLKESPFPEYENERFLSEDICWIEIAKKYDSVYINKAIYECEYLSGGLTANDKPMKFKSPNGSMLRGKRLMYKRCGLRANIKGAIIYNCYKNVKSDYEVFLDTFYEKMLVFITRPFGLFFYSRWSKSFED